MGQDEYRVGVKAMIHIEVDYQGSRSIETASFTSTGNDYIHKLNEIEAYKGRIDRIRVYVGSDNVTENWDQHGMNVKVDTTSVGVAIRKAKAIKY